MSINYCALYAVPTAYRRGYSKVYPEKVHDKKPHKYISIYRTILLHLLTPRLPPLFSTTPTKDTLHRLPTPKIQPTAQKYNPKIESTICPKDAISLPLQAIKYIKALRELVSVGILAKFAQAIGPILDVAA